MKIKILQVFYDENGLPFKDKERVVHYPIAQGTFMGSSNTTQIRFYYDRMLEEGETTFVAVSKLPNGKVGSKILESHFDSELNENYVLLDLSNYYTQYKGDLFISLQGYEGGVRVEEDENGIYQIYGTPTIQATGSIRLAINYATQFVGSGETENITLQRVLAELATKLGIRQETLQVEELPEVGDPNVWYVVNDDTNDPNKANIYIWNAKTQSYVWVGDNTLNLGNYYTKEEGEQFEQGIDNRLTSVEDELEGVASGSPSGTYATVSDLTTADPDHSKIYLVLADGKWYYWNTTNEEWTAGGTYLSTGNAVQNTRIVGDVQLDQDIPASLLEKTLGLKDFKDGFKSKDLFNQAYRKGADGTYVYASDGHVTYNASSYSLYTFILKIDGTKTYTFSGSCTFAVLLKADLYTCASSVLTSTSQIDCSQYEDAEYLAFTLEGTQTTIISEGQSVVQGYELPKWFTNEVIPYKQPTKTVRASSMGNADYIRTDIRTNVRKNERVIFKATFSSGGFNAIQIGLNYAESFGVAYRRNYFVIDNTTISYYLTPSDSTPQKTENHGLTIENEIELIGEYLDNGQFKLTILSNGYSYTMTISYYYKVDIGQYFVFSDGSTLSNCVLSWTCIDIKEKIWIFGDSYIAYEMDRWAYYLHQDGYDKNVLFDGFPGESSAYGITALNDLLKIGAPKFAIWLLGMNDGTDVDDNTPNSTWATNRDLFLSICAANNITPIFGTIPNVPSVNNKGKNKWIRNSGFRYIDMAVAVGSEISTSWYSGMQASDHVHPSWLGARPLNNQVLADFPEIMVDKL